MTVIDDLPRIGQRPAKKRPPSTVLLAVIAVIAMLATAGVFIAVILTGQSAQNETAAVKQDTAPAVLTLDQLCKRQDQLGSDLRAIPNACSVTVDKAKQAVQGEPAPVVGGGTGLDRDQVVALVNSQIAGKAVTVNEVMDLVAQVYAAHPPAPGKDAPAPTAEQVLAAVTAVCGSARCQGPKGDQGEPGANATDDQVRAQVDAYCGAQADGSCKGAKGDQGVAGPAGADGRAVTGQAFVWVSATQCVSRVTFSGNATVDSATVDSNAGDSACDPATRPVVTTGTP
jgi:hypothetical protein